MFERCLVCTDFSDGLHRLIHFVPELAASGCQQIVFVHTVPFWDEWGVPRVDHEKIDQARTRLLAATMDCPADTEVQIEVVSGKPTETIPKLVAHYHSQVVMLGTPTRSLAQETIFGSTTVGLTRSLTQPLMILRPQLISTYTREELSLRCQHLWRYLLIPYNGSEAAQYLIQELKTILPQNDQQRLQACLLVWVITESGGRREFRYEVEEQMAQEKLADVQAELEAYGLQVETVVRSGDPMDELNDVALEFDISAIATAYVSRGALMDWTAPSFANEILRHSWFPVLFFSPQE
ncbi:universal stress protein [Spirulina major]|uniref:universal stress protein n=1 Tax=Spirulina major TaxID=270636 RepID=UPI0009355CC2|nr:universal stress protein [Spirulina major]